MPCMIYHTPYQLRTDGTVASALRPRRMLQAFKNLGYEVIDFTGTGRQRRAKLAILRKRLQEGLQVDFCYSESATVPNAFTEKHHFPLRLFVERNLFRLLHRYHVPIGVFYRDVYWVFPAYKRSIPAIVYPVMRALYQWDVRVYNRYVDALFVPSPGYAEHTPGLKVALTPNLPPGTDPEKGEEAGALAAANLLGEPSAGSDSNAAPATPATPITPSGSADPALRLFYVGSVGGELYDMTPLRLALQNLPQVHLTLCTPRNELWQREVPLWEVLDNVTIIHQSSDQLAPAYAQTDVCLMFIRPGEYRDFAVPYKFFEYLSYGKPVITSTGTYMQRITEELGHGWTLDFTQTDLEKLLLHLVEHPEEVAAKTAIAHQVSAENTWEVRAQTVSDTLQMMHSQRGQRARRLLIVSRIYQPEAAAASFRLAAVQDAFLRHGWNVDVLTTRFEQARSTHSRCLRVFRWPALRDQSGYLRGYLPYLSYDLPLVFRLLVVRKPNAVLVEPPPTTGVVARLICRLRGIPYFWYAPDIWSDAVKESSSRLVASVVGWMERFAIRGARCVVTANPGFVSKLLKLGARRVEVAENGADTEVYTPAGEILLEAERAQLGIEKPYLIYAGTASEWQQAEIFAAAFAADERLRETMQLVFVGNGTSWPKIAEIARKLAAQGLPQAIRLLSPQSPKMVAKMLRGAVAALVSIRPDSAYDYAYPTKVFAALACGTPVVYAGSGPARADIREQELGWATSFDLVDIQDALHKALRKTLGEASNVAAHEATSSSGNSGNTSHNEPGESSSTDTSPTSHHAANSANTNAATSTATSVTTRDLGFAKRVSRWVREHHSLRATGERVFEIITHTLGTRR